MREVHTETMIVWAVVMAGAMVQGMTGLGFALVSVPILVLFEDPRSVIATTLILSALLNGLILYRARGRVSLRNAGPITGGTLLGVPLGSYLLTVMSPQLLKEAVAALVLLFSVPLLLGFSTSFRHKRAASLVTGAVSGALQSSTSMGSPPMVLFMANQQIDKESFRALLVLRSVAASSLSVAVLVPSGVVNPALAEQALLLAPALVVGFFVGNRLLALVPQRLFRRLTLALVAGAAVLSLLGSLL